MTGRRPASLRRLLALLLTAFGLLVGALIVIAALQLEGSQSQAAAENRRSRSFLLADSMRQSSNDLTNMVRLYVSTGAPRYRAYYDEILAIRSGEAPRPRDYDSAFWDRVLAEGKRNVRYGPPLSLEAQMREARFAPEEFDALRAALSASDELARIELDVMERVNTRSGQATQGEYRRLVDDAYLAEKGRIMAAINRFVALVERRTLEAVEAVRTDNRNLSRAQIAILALIVLLAIVAMVVLSRRAVRPLDSLVGAAHRIAGGDYEHRTEVGGVAELTHVAGAFNEMAEAVESKMAARRRAEHEAVAARQAAEHASRTKSTFLAAMSHEIRTPMIGVTGMLEVLARTELTPQQRQMTATAQASAASLLQIIGDILDFSKIEADKLELNPVTFELRAAIGPVIDNFVHTASTKGLQLGWEADDALAPAHVGDPLRLRQIISNLVSNAVKFTDAGGIDVRVRVLETGPGAQTVAIAVTDTGVGIPEDQQATLFEEFAQAHGPSAARQGGTGLGLVICRRLAQLMGGEITMRSAPGRGTTMTLTVPLPLGDPADVSAETLHAPLAPATRRKPTRAEAIREGSLILLAEDHPVNRTVLKHQLDAIGFEVDVFQDGLEGFDAWQSGDYALVLTDLNMPRLDGYGLARRIRAEERRTGRGHTPIIALSANVMEGEPDRCRAAGMDDFGAKPTTIPFLASRLRHALPHLEWTAERARPATAAPPATESLADPVALEELTGGDRALAAELVADFLDSSQADLRALEAAIEEHDLETAGRQAHRIKGAARIVGARRLERPAQRIETIARDGGDWDELPLLAAEIGSLLGAGDRPQPAARPGR